MKNEYENPLLYQLAKQVVDMNNSKPFSIGKSLSFETTEEIEIFAQKFADEKLKVVSGLLSEDYKTGYKEGIEHFLQKLNGI